jgi:hypothetical protein
VPNPRALEQPVEDGALVSPTVQHWLSRSCRTDSHENGRS